MGAPKKPMALRELHGTANRNKQRNNDNAPVPTRGIGPPAEALNEYEQAIWDEVVGHMYSGVLGEADRLPLGMMCRLIAEMRLNFEGMTAAKITQLSNLMARFGMTPSDRTKIVIPKESAKNPFESL